MFYGHLTPDGAIKPANIGPRYIDAKYLGATREDYMHSKRARLTDEAKKCFDMVEQPIRDNKSKVSALECAQYYLKEAGFDPADESAYVAIKTTKANFDALRKKERELAHREFGF